MFHKICGEPVEELRVGGAFSFDSEVVGVSSKWFAKMILPNPIDDRSGSQPVLVVSNPLSEGESTSIEIIGDEVGILSRRFVYWNP